MPPKKLNSALKDLKGLSLNEDDSAYTSEDIDAMWKARAISSYQQSYQPMAAGLRTTLWADGFQQREARKKGGFTHFKLEWMAPTFRGRKSLGSSPELSKSPDNPDGVEKLILQPTKLERKKAFLQRVYDRKLRRLSKKSKEQVEKSQTPSTGRSKYVGITDYERNRLNNMKSQIVLPTLSSCGSTARLSTMSLSQRSVISAMQKAGSISPKKVPKHDQGKGESVPLPDPPNNNPKPSKDKSSSPAKNKYKVSHSPKKSPAKKH